ncbi:RxLR-like protein [Plasmopara halstedii]|uniref:RxLR-like protein n=1 Tax=Plasmopara halstedii TaxID=4781 RepID=A0A0P1ATT9_PLAHL|nr:RxLR-like protein [Plasmopara halstedii]CEG44951.1 RxLR-like protein [Plasmopara halstedii]|eukprot:XP_024581320.1 RxLR-like protein [Plasmopara halstedii]
MKLAAGLIFAALAYNNVTAGNQMYLRSSDPQAQDVSDSNDSDFSTFDSLDVDENDDKGDKDELVNDRADFLGRQTHSIESNDLKTRIMSLIGSGSGVADLQDIIDSLHINQDSDSSGLPKDDESWHLDSEGNGDKGVFSKERKENTFISDLDSDDLSWISEDKEKNLALIDSHRSGMQNFLDTFANERGSDASSSRFDNSDIFSDSTDDISSEEAKEKASVDELDSDGISRSSEDSEDPTLAISGARLKDSPLINDSDSNDEIPSKTGLENQLTKTLL